MRVLLSADTVGGVWDYAATLARGLEAGGAAVMVAVVGEPSPEQLALLPAAAEVVARPYRLEWMPEAGEHVAAAGEWLRETAERWRASVVHLNQMAYAAERFCAPTLVVVHSDVRSWFGEVLGEPASAGFAAYTRWVRRGLAAAELVVAPTHYQSRLAARHYGRAADVVVHNGMAPPETTPAPRAVPLLVSAGRAWDRAKGMDVLDAALARLGDAAPEAHLLGPLHGPHGEHFSPRRLRAHGRLGRRSVDGWLRRASIYVGASRYEPFGLAPLEAALHGCALLLSDIGSFRELWDGAAFFFRAGDADDLARAIEEAAAAPGAVAERARAAGQRARERYTAQRMAGEYLRLYHSLARAATTTAAARAAGRAPRRMAGD